MVKIILLLSAWSISASAANCDFSAYRRVLSNTSLGHTAEWTFADQPQLNQPLETTNQNYISIRKWIAANSDLTWRGYLERHEAVVRDALKDAKDDPDLKSDVEEVTAILQGKIGRIMPMACLESIPYLEFLSVVNLQRFPQEFSAYVFKKQGRVKILGDFYLTPASQGGAPGVPTGVNASPFSQAERKRLVSQGWQLYAHIHDHTFVFENDSGDLGGNLAPSKPDVLFYLEAKPALALITNGIDTISMNADDFSSLRQTIGSN